ncbi:hypothetical protein [Streptomyces lydicus]|uniref:hypothetical protein n=1 Tax=Streptomyces lydicus TaxID=47763 RepID=UPI0036F548BC
MWHIGYGIEINLSLPGLGHPRRPDLLREITASVADRDPQLLECLAHHDGRECLSEAGGICIGREIQYHHLSLSPSSVHRRSVNAMQHDITPLWVAKDRTASLIDRAPWARVDDMPWKDIAGGKEMVSRGGYRHLQVCKCVRSVRH